MLQFIVDYQEKIKIKGGEIDSESIKNQKLMLTNYAIEKGWNIYKIYSDDDYSGSDDNRPEFNELLDDAKNHKFDIVLCKSQSRFTRNMEKVERYIHTDFPAWNIRFIGLTDNADTDVKGNKKARQINGLVNEWYLEDLSENIRASLNEKRKEGLHIGGTARFGYKKDPSNKGKLIIDPVASQYVKRIFDLYESGKGTVFIAKTFNEENIPKPSLYKRMYIKSDYKSSVIVTSKWTDRTIRHILVEPMYTGTMVQGRRKKLNYKVDKEVSVPKSDWYVVENTHEAIISKEQFNRVQEIMKNRTRANIHGEKHIFAGKVRCLNCGSRLKKIKNGAGQYYFKCIKSMSPIYECSPLNRILCKDLEKIILEKIKEKISMYCNFDSITLKNKSKTAIDDKLINVEIVKINTEIDNLVNAISSLYLDKINDIISENEFLEIKEILTSKKASKEKIISDLKTELESEKQKKVNNEYMKKVINKYKNIDTLNLGIINLFIGKIFIGEKSKDKKQDIEIYWNF